MQAAQHTNQQSPQTGAHARTTASAQPAGGRSAGGFTLIEMLIVLVILGVLLMIAAPAFQQMIRNNRMVSEVYGLRAIINTARSEALSLRTPVVVCPTADGTTCASSNDWTTGYLTYVDTDGDDTLDAGEEVIQVEARQIPTTITFDNAAQRVRYSPQGTAIGSAGTFSFCDDRGPTEASALILNAVGSLRAATDTDGTPDGIVNDAGGSNVSC